MKSNHGKNTQKCKNNLLKIEKMQKDVDEYVELW